MRHEIGDLEVLLCHYYGFARDANLGWLFSVTCVLGIMMWFFKAWDVCACALRECSYMGVFEVEVQSQELGLVVETCCLLVKIIWVVPWEWEHDVGRGSLSTKACLLLVRMILVVAE